MERSIWRRVRVMGCTCACSLQWRLCEQGISQMRCRASHTGAWGNYERDCGWDVQYSGCQWVHQFQEVSCKEKNHAMSTRIDTPKLTKLRVAVSTASEDDAIRYEIWKWDYSLTVMEQPLSPLSYLFDLINYASLILLNKLSILFHSIIVWPCGWYYKVQGWAHV